MLMGMEIIDAKWTPKVNLLKIKCCCGNKFYHRADRKKVKFFNCNRAGYLWFIRKQYRMQNQRKITENVNNT